LIRLHAAQAASVVIKLGAAGCLFSDGATVMKIAAAPVATVTDTTAAGDAFNAGFLAAWLKGHGPEDCCRAANALAGVVIQHRGAIIPASATPLFAQLTVHRRHTGPVP
jgi:2-dehydro-3-deoxygluconokinase